MIRIVIASIVLATTSLNCFFAGGNAVRGSGTVAAETRSAGKFTKVRVDGIGDVAVTIGETQSLSVSADDNLLPLIETKVTGEELVISTTQSVSPKSPVKVTITVPSLTGATINGAGDIKVSGLKETSFVASVRGSGTVTADGTADKVDGSIAGSGDLRLGGLSSKDAKVSISGSGSAHVDASDSVSASISGSGDIVYSGKPKQVQKQIGGSGSVRAK